MGLRDNLTRDCSNRPKENPLRADGVGVMPILSSSDSEEDDIPFGMYRALPQDLTDNNIQEEDNCVLDNDGEEANVDDDDDDDEEEDDDEDKDLETENESKETTLPETFTFDQATKFEVTELWNSSNNRITDIVMDSTKVEQIKNAMAGFKLPSTAIPPWAEEIPEEEWKKQIINKVNFVSKQSPKA